MLKPADPGGQPQPDQKPIAELLQQLVDDGKAYARAELDLAQTIAKAKGKALALPLGLFAAALICALAGIAALSLGIVIALAKFVGPLAAGFIGLLIFAAIAGSLGWYGARRLEDIF